MVLNNILCRGNFPRTPCRPPESRQSDQDDAVAGERVGPGEGGGLESLHADWKRKEILDIGTAFGELYGKKE